MAWTSPFIVKIVNDTENYNITENEASYFATIHPLSIIIFSLIAPKLNDFISRRTGVIITVIPQISFWILTAIAKNVYTFYAARVLSGLGDTLHYCSVPMYLGEIATPSVRGSWANLVFFVIFGEVLVNLIGQNFSVQHTAYFFISLSLLFISLICFLPESPYYCVAKNMEDKAKKSLRYLRGKEDVEIEFIQIKSDVERQMSEQGTLKDLFCIKANRKALLVGVFLRASQQFSGIAAIQCYTQFIFEKSVSSISSSTSTVLVIGLLCSFSLIFGHIAERFGRRKSYIYSMAACVFMLFLEFTYFFMDEYTVINVTTVNWIPLGGMVLYIIFNSFGVILVPTIMLGELFSNSIKTKGAGALTIALGVFLFLANNFFYILNSKFGLCAPFLGYAIISTFSVIISIYIIPETKGKTLEEIQQILKGTKQ